MKRNRPSPELANSIDWKWIIGRVFAEECKHEVTKMLMRDVSKALSELTWKESHVIVMRSCGMTLKDIGNCIGVQQERVRQIEAKAFRKLRHPTRIRLIEKFIILKES